jgi:SAM-dependent methyltransferase
MTALGLDWDSSIFGPENFTEFTYSRKDHFRLFKRLSEDKIDIDRCDLKDYQDLLVYNFIFSNISKGSRILDVGGGDSRILKKFSDSYECWNIDKMEGLGAGPTSFKPKHYILIKDYIGNFNSQLPNEYFDFVFSISALEHVPEDKDIFRNICLDIDRVLKPGGYSLHCFDIVLREGGADWTNGLLWFFYQYFKIMNPPITFESIRADSSLFYMGEIRYNKYWKQITKLTYTEFGRPVSYNILWRKEATGPNRETHQA